MRLLTVHPGAFYATADVYEGIVPALAALGHEIIQHRLDQRIERAGAWLHHDWRAMKRRGYDGPKPNPADVMYLASYTILEMALRQRVDWVLVISGMYIHPDMLVLLARAGVRVAILLSESPYDDERQMRVLPLVDLAWTNERASVAGLRQANREVHYLPHAIDPARHAVKAPNVDIALTVPAHDVVFVGTGFQERIELLAGVDWTGIDLGLYGEWTLLGSRHPLRQHLRGGPLPNARAVALYRRAKIGLNLHRQSKGFGKDAPRITCAESVNPRALELAACGTFQLSDRRPELEELFGSAVPTFRDGAGLEGLIRRWLPDDAGRERVAAALPSRVAGETFAARAAQVTADLTRVGAALDARKAS